MNKRWFSVQLAIDILLATPSRRMMYWLATIVSCQFCNQFILMKIDVIVFSVCASIALRSKGSTTSTVIYLFSMVIQFSESKHAPWFITFEFCEKLSSSVVYLTIWQRCCLGFPFPPSPFVFYFFSVSGLVWKSHKFSLSWLLLISVIK